MLREGGLTSKIAGVLMRRGRGHVDRCREGQGCVMTLSARELPASWATSGSRDRQGMDSTSASPEGANPDDTH